MLYDLTPTQGLCELLRILNDYQQIFDNTTDDPTSHELWDEYENLLSTIWDLSYQLLEGKS